jgi:hypothetical protein
VPQRAVAPASASGDAAGAAAAKPANGAKIGIGAAVVAALGVGAYLATRGPAPQTAAPAAQTAAPAAAAVAPAVPPAAAPTPAPAKFDPPEEFKRVVQAQTAGFDVRVKTSATSYRIAKDELSFTVQTERDGYVYVFVYGADNQLVRLYPSVTAGALRVRKGQVLTLPPKQDMFKTTGPAGPTDLLVMVSARQRDHSVLKPRTDGPVLLFPSGAEAAALAAQYPGPGPAMAGNPVCPTSEPCADEYGAAQVRVEVVP